MTKGTNRQQNVSTLPTNGTIKKILSIGADDYEHYIGIANNSQTGFQPAWIIGGKFYDGAAPSIFYAANSNQWVHIVSVKTLDKLKLYINGNLVSQINHGSFPQYDHNPRARIITPTTIRPIIQPVIFLSSLFFAE